MFTRTATRKKRRDSSDQNLEKKAKLRTRSRLSAGNQSQLVRSPVASSRPETKTANLHPPHSAKRATIGTLTADDRTLMAMRPPTAWARFRGEMTSDIAATALGGSIPPPRPVMTLSSSSNSRLGAKAEAMTDTVSNSSPASMTGRRPKESDSGPTETTERAHAAKVTVAS